MRRIDDTLSVCAICIRAVIDATQRGYLRESIENVIAQIRQNGSYLIDHPRGFYAKLAVTQVNGTDYCAWHSTKIFPAGYTGEY